MKKIFSILVLFPMLLLGQTTTENFVKTTTYKGAGATLPVVQVTYFDGLGRPIQQIANAQSATGKDIVTYMEYDALGRMPKEYLPYANSAPSLSYNPNVKTEIGTFYNTATYENTSNPYSEKLFEASPLNRVVKQAAPGTPWAMNAGREIKLDYQTNTATEVKKFTVTGTFNNAKGLFDAGVVDSGNFPVNQLYKSVTKDENWTTGDNNTTQEFKNKEGQVVLKRTFNNNVAHDTYYVYDIRGNLAYVIPPLAEGVVTQNVLDGLCYQYKYDYRNRLVEKKLPGKQWEFIVYDKLDRPLATGPALSPFSNLTGSGWLVTKYDVFNRPVLTAWLPATVSSTARKTQQDAITAATVLSETKTATTTNTTVNGVAFRYSNVAWPTSAYHVLTVNYYDDYNFPNAPTIPATVETQAVYYNSTTKPKGLATGSWVRAVETSLLFKAEEGYILYDKKSRPIRTYTKNHLGGYTQVDSKLDFIGKTEYTLTTHKRLAADAVLTVKDLFSYSTQDRLVLHKQQINALPEQLIIKNTYDELGQLISKNVGGTDVTGAFGLQKVDYSYNIRGWLTGINDIEKLLINPHPQDLFSFKLNYNSPDSASALYNGNISETYWRTSNDNVLRKYNYTYDNLNRLTWAGYQKPETASGQTPNYDEGLSYDKNGNIISLIRNGDLDSDGAVGANIIDNLAYTYHSSNKNQLMKVFDNTNNPQGFKDETANAGISDLVDDYSYDANGNMIADTNKGITDIKYNHLNLPTKIFFGSNTIEYLYNATGQKLQKKVTQGATITITEYLTGFQYKNNVLLFFPHAEGYVNNAAGIYNYVFNYTDHLGNVRISYTTDANTGSLKILEENHYYPFGMKHTNYNSDVKMLIEDDGLIKIKPTPASPYQYKYNGKELQDELGLNFYDYGARNYDAAIGRWMNIDPLAENSRRWTPYNYTYNNPIYFVDPDGMQADDWKRDANGDLTFDPTLTAANQNTGKLGVGERYVGTATSELAKNDAGETYTINYNSDGSISESSSSRELNVRDDSPTGPQLFLNGLGNTALGVVGTIASAAYVLGTDGAGAALGGTVALTLSLGEIGIGLDQMADSFSANPDPTLHNYATVPGQIAGRNGSEYAPLVDGVAGWIPGSLTGGNVKGTMGAFEEIKQGKNTVLNSASIIDATLDGKGLKDGVTSAVEETYKKK